MKKSQPGRRRLLGAAAALIGTAAIFALLFSSYARHFERAMTEENRSRLEEVSGHVAAYMERAAQQQWEELRIAALAASALPDREARIAYLDSVAEELDFASIGLAEEDGLLYGSAFHEPQDISEEDYFLAARSGEDYMTGVRRQIFWDRAVTGVILSVPASEGTGEAVVAMLGTSNLEADVQVDSFDGNGISYVIDAEGEQILHARSMGYSNFFQALQNLTFETGYSLGAMKADIASGRAGMTSYSDLGVEKYAYYRPLSFGGWTVVSVVPKGIVTARTSALSRELILVCAAAALIFLGLLITVGLLLLRLESRRRANRAKTDFLANMSHDMRTPMNAIMGMAAIAETHAGDPGTVRDCMRKIGYSSRHLLGLINDMLDMSRIESGKMVLAQEPFSLADLLESVENMTLPRILAKRQEFSMRLHGVTHEYLVGDSLRLSQIFVNILTNAMKFTPEGGRIAVEAEELPSEKPDIVLFRFTFTDNGIGMKPEFLKDLFTPFSRERSSRVDKTEGSGLGMAITKRILDLMGGRIEVKSAEGEGSVFSLTIPLTRNPAAPEDAPLPPWRILLVGCGAGEEEELPSYFGSLGLRADLVRDKEAALRQLSGHPYQAVLLDRAAYSAETAAALRKALDGAAFLFLSGYQWEDVREEAVQAGIQFFLQKPLLRSALSQAFRKAAAGESGRDSAAFPRYAFPGKHILVAEDNELNLEIVRSVLSETGANIVWAPDGADCVALFEASPVGSIDLILMDIQMPRLNGYDAARSIRSLQRDDAGIPILAMSANAYPEDIAAASEAGMDGYLTKPIDPAVWLAEMEKLLFPTQTAENW